MGTKCNGQLLEILRQMRNIHSASDGVGVLDNISTHVVRQPRGWTIGATNVSDICIPISLVLWRIPRLPKNTKVVVGITLISLYFWMKLFNLNFTRITNIHLSERTISSSTLGSPSVANLRRTSGLRTSTVPGANTSAERRRPRSISTEVNSR